MKRYVISWYDHFTMTLKSEVADAENDFEALDMAFKKLTRKSAVGKVIDIPGIKALACQYDGAINAIEIYEPEHLPATQVIKRFIKGASNAIPVPSKGLPQYAH